VKKEVVVAEDYDQQCIMLLICCLAFSEISSFSIRKFISSSSKFKRE